MYSDTFIYQENDGRRHASNLYYTYSTVIPCHLFTNNPSHLFQINPLHAYRWPNGGPAWARRPRATALAQACHADLLTGPGTSCRPTDCAGPAC
jgi:hypothetical protein